MSNEIKSAIERLGTTAAQVAEHNQKLFDTLQDRIEAVEAGADRPRANIGSGKAADHKTFHTPGGPVYELPSHVRLADVMPAVKQPEISLDRWLAATVAGERCGDKIAVEYAREAKQMLTTSTGVLIPAEYQSQWIDLLRARSVLNTAGMRTVTMGAKTQVHSAVTADPSVTWHSENGSISAANPTFAARTLTAQTIVARCTASVELSQDSPDFGAQLAKVMTGAVAAEIDRVGLEGTGSAPQPRGIKNTSGRSSQTATGALTSYGKIVTGLGTLLSANNDLAQISKFAVMSPGSWAAYEALVTGISSDKSQLVRPQAIRDMQFLVSSNVAGNAASSPQILSTIFLGDFRELLLGVRLESSIEVLKLTSFASNLLLEFVAYARVDFLVTRPAAFHTVEGVLA